MNWGIRGTGGIAHLLAQGLAAAQTGRLVAVGSRTREAAQAFGATDAVEAAHRHASYEDLLADAAVEVVSIALPNHLHAAWTMAAADAGKPLLCEKPLTAGGERVSDDGTAWLRARYDDARTSHDHRAMPAGVWQ